MHEVLRRLAQGGASNLEVLELSGNELGETVTSDITIFTKLKKLDLSNGRLGGKRFVEHQHTCVVCLLTFSSCFAGELPKQLPVSLEVLNLGGSISNTNKFTGGIPSEWGALTNLKELNMVACGLDGAICMSQHTCVV